MDESVISKKYEVNSIFVNAKKQLGLYAVLNLLQDMAWFHAARQGHGRKDLEKRKNFWVLTRQKLYMERWPTWGEEIEIRTWIRPPNGAFISRDFEILHSGERVGASTTSWLMLSAESRKPVRGDTTQLGFTPRADYELDFSADKINLLPESELIQLTQFEVRNSDLDLNQHVNNTRYAQWVLDSIPAAWHQTFDLHEYEVNFLAETKSGDLISIFKSVTEEGFASTSPQWVQFQGWRAMDQKFVFCARLLVSALSQSPPIASTREV
jgi:medium-chain acyl-[acyl-carrier-protein] hydrolase